MTRPHRSFAGVAGSRQVAAVLVLLAVVLVAAAAWWGMGGRWLTINSPSMAQAAPVGTLVLTRPVDVADLDVGDIITFTPPGSAMTYTHRVHELMPGGVVMTKGDTNADPDSWALHQRDIEGVVVARWWGMGWVLKALPFLVIAVAVIVLATRRFVSERWRKPSRLFLVPFAVAIAGLIYRPWVGLTYIDQLGVGSTQDAPVARLVSTGLLPVRAFLADHPDTSVRLVSGQVGDLPLLAATTTHAIPVDGMVALQGWWWVAVIAVCLLPLFYELATLRGDRGDDSDAFDDDQDDSGDRGNVLVGTAVILSLDAQRARSERGAEAVS